MNMIRNRIVFYSSMGLMLKYSFYTVALIVGLFLLTYFALDLHSWLEYRLPSQQYARQQFEDHRADFAKFAKLLHDDNSVTFIEANGRADSSAPSKFENRYPELMRKIGAKFIIIREDGSMEFALWGNGGAIMSDSYMGVRYFPNDHKTNSAVGYTQVLVTSLDSKKLPQANGDVATGLYVVPIEPEWFLYRFEYQE